MTDHAALLRQIRNDARPYVEQALDLAEVFTGFRKLASENGLDWGVIKALIKAEVQDEREGGSEKVERIIEKADFASAYADMLGLGTKMNEENLSSEEHRRLREDRYGPPHDPSTGELIEEPATPPGLVAVGDASTSPQEVQACSDASPILSNAAGPAASDVEEYPSPLSATCRADASLNIPQASDLPPEAQAATSLPPPGVVAAPFELEDIPPGLDSRSKAA